jgi:hypothetical protein
VSSARTRPSSRCIAQLAERVPQPVDLGAEGVERGRQGIGGLDHEAVGQLAADDAHLVPQGTDDVARRDVGQVVLQLLDQAVLAVADQAALQGVEPDEQGGDVGSQGLQFVEGPLGAGIATGARVVLVVGHGASVIGLRAPAILPHHRPAVGHSRTRWIPSPG